MINGSHICPVAGCTAQIPNKLLMCATHWRRVPLHLKTGVWTSVRRNGHGTVEHRAVCLEVIRHVSNEGATK